MDYSDFLNTTKVIRMLYGTDKSRIFFQNNIVHYKQLFETIDLFVEK